MNVIKTIGRKGVVVGLSLALCATMVSPAFAAQVLNNENKGQFIGENGALLGHDGNGGAGNQYDYELGESLELEKTLVIGAGVSASIDLKGNDLKHTGATGSVITIQNGGELELDDTTAATDDEGNYTAGRVTGGKGATDKVLPGSIGGGVYIEKDGKLDMKGGIISDNTARWGGGIGNNGTVVMSGGQISGNMATEGKHGVGGGVFNANNFTMKDDAAIIGNTSNGDGGGVYNSGDFVMENGKINGNTTKADGGGVHMYTGWRVSGATGSFIMKNGEIADNTVLNSSGGGVGLEDGIFTMNGGSIVRNEAPKINGVASYSDGTIITVNDDNVIICNYGNDGVETRHNPGEAVRENVVEPQIGVPGSYDEVVYCKECDGELNRTPMTIPALEEENNGGNNGGNAGAPIVDTPATVEIEDEAVPLAGLFTRADAIGYLWEQSGSPEAELSTFEDVPEDHEWAVAIGWAQDMGIAVADQEGNFRPDDLVLRWVEDLEAEPEGEFEEFLNRYAVFAGIELDAGELFVELGGEPTDIVMGEDAQAIFDSFFAKLAEALEELAA